MTTSEMMRLQGWNGPFERLSSEATFGKLLGNAMSVNVVERVLLSLLPAANLVLATCLRDRWQHATSVAQE